MLVGTTDKGLIEAIPNPPCGGAEYFQAKLGAGEVKKRAVSDAGIAVARHMLEVTEVRASDYRISYDVTAPAKGRLASPQWWAGGFGQLVTSSPGEICVLEGQITPKIAQRLLGQVRANLVEEEACDYGQEVGLQTFAGFATGLGENDMLSANLGIAHHPPEAIVNVGGTVYGLIPGEETQKLIRVRPLDGLLADTLLT